MNFYNTTDREATAEYKDRGSRFLAYVFPFTAVTELKPLILKLKKEHPKASHFCFAYRIGIDGNTFRSSDDGEPAGTAGKPILGQIDAKNLTDVIVVVVRYFGGSLLGVPGLITAYKTAASFVLQVVRIVQKPVLAMYTLHFDYTSVNEVMVILKHFNCLISERSGELFCEMKVGIPLSREQDVIYRLKESGNVEILSLV